MVKKVDAKITENKKFCVSLISFLFLNKTKNKILKFFCFKLFFLINCER